MNPDATMLADAPLPKTDRRVTGPAQAVRLQRQAGNGTLEDLAAFCCVCKRQAVAWKENGIVGHTQIGRNVWISEDDVAELPAQYHRSGKFSKVAPSEVPNLVRKQWREFLGVLADDRLEETRRDIEALKRELAELKNTAREFFTAKNA